MSSDILSWVTKDGSSDFKAESGRYHLYISTGCPFAHRTSTVRALKGLEDVVSMDNVDYIPNPDKGWRFSPEKEGCDADTVNGKEFLREVYSLSHPEYAGKITVPVLFDKKTKKIVSNSSADILRMLNSEFSEFSATPEQAKIDLYPATLKEQIDELNAWITPEVAFGVYHVGRAAKENQETYDQKIESLFNGLDKIEKILSTSRYLAGDKMTEADIRLFVVLIRFDIVYYPLMMCSKKPLMLYKNIWPYIRDLYQTSTIASTVNIQQIKGLYYSSKAFADAGFKVIPAGPNLDYNEPHNRQS